MEAVHQGLHAGGAPAAGGGYCRHRQRNSGVVLALDQITDPHNVGAILRTACAFGVDALILTERHSPEFSGVLAKAASGALEHVTIVAVVNLARALDELSRARLRADWSRFGRRRIARRRSPLSKPLALVLGAEGKGLRRLTRERCDVVARLDLPGADQEPQCLERLRRRAERLDGCALGEAHQPAGLTSPPPWTHTGSAAKARADLAQLVEQLICNQ